MSSWFHGLIANASVFGEVIAFFWSNKKWWLIPMVLMLLLLGLLLIFASASGIGPFIYTLF